MICSGFANFSPDQLEQLPPPPLPLRYTVNDGCAVESTRAVRKQSSGRDSADYVEYVIKLVSQFDVLPGEWRPKPFRKNEISERARQRGEQRRLRRLAALEAQATISVSMLDWTCCTVLTITQNPYEVESPGTAHTLKPRPQPSTPTKASNQTHLHLPIKLTRKPSNQPQPMRYHKLNPPSLLAAPVAPHQISTTRGSPTPYSESRGELQRQFVVNQRLQRDYHIEPCDLVEADISLGKVGQSNDARIRVPGFRIHAEKLLQRVSALRVQRIGRGSVADLGRPKKVRFAPVVECFEF